MKRFVFDALKGVLFSLSLLVIFTFLFALVLKIFPLPNSAVFPVSESIKALSVFLGCFFSVGKEKGLLKGALVGFFALLLSHLLFFAIGGGRLFSVFFLLELLFGALIGALSGILRVNLPK